VALKKGNQGKGDANVEGKGEKGGEAGRSLCDAEVLKGEKKIIALRPLKSLKKERFR